VRLESSGDPRSVCGESGRIQSGPRRKLAENQNFGGFTARFFD
jgi:hypothetical protein